MRHPLLLTAFVLLAAATSSAQTFVFKGERWEINDPFKLDNSIPPKPVDDSKKGIIDVVKGTIDRTSNQAGFEVASEALQVMGGTGYSQEVLVEYCLRRCRGWMIAGGSIEIMKNRIAEGIFGRSFPQRP